MCSYFIEVEDDVMCWGGWGFGWDFKYDDSFEMLLSKIRVS